MSADISDGGSGGRVGPGVLRLGPFPKSRLLTLVQRLPESSRVPGGI